MSYRGLGANGEGRERDRQREDDASCITCGDAARRMRVLEVDEARALALCVDEQERRQTIDIGIVGAVAPGEALLVHAGTALVRESG